MKTPSWSVSPANGLWLAEVRWENELLPVGYTSSRGVAEALASSMAMQLQGHRLRQEWLDAAH